MKYCSLPKKVYFSTTKPSIDDLYHHGILGMKWGKRNGPPYPLGPEDHSASEKKAGYKKSIGDGRNENLYERNNKNNPAKAVVKKPSYSERKEQKAKAEEKARKAIEVKKKELIEALRKYDPTMHQQNLQLQRFVNQIQQQHINYWMMTQMHHF